MKIFFKGLLLVAIPSLCQLVLLGVLVKAQLQSIDAERAALRGKQVISEAANVLAPMLLEANRVFGAVITNDIGAIDHPDVWRDLAVRLDHLQQLVADNPQQSAAVDRMRNNVTAFRAWSVQSRDLLLREQEVELVARFRNVAVQKELSEFRKELAAFQTEGLRLDRQRVQLLRDSRSLQRQLLFAAIAGSLLMAALSAYFFSRGIAARLATLTVNAERLADGVPLAARLGGRDEISRLDAVLHQTSTRLAAAEQIASAYREELEQRATELATANEHLRQQTADNDMFVYSVSHDLRSPLVNMQGFSKEIAHGTEELRTLLRPFDDREEQNRIDAILHQDIPQALHFLQTAVLRTADIIDALLRLSRAGRLEYHLQQVEVEPIVRRVIDAMQATVRERGAEVVLKPLPSVWGDAGAIDQIFSNLIGNAVNYLDPERRGRIEIGCLADAPDTALPPSPHASANTSHATLTPSSHTHSPTLSHTFYVSDNGSGIADAYQAKAFTAFQRFHGGSVKGEGIGLALVLRVVERQGGRVWFTSQEGVGSTFYIALPASAAGTTMEQVA